MRPKSTAEIAEGAEETKKELEMQPNSLPISSAADATPGAFWRVASAALLVLGGALTIGALWLPWRHYTDPDGTAAIFYPQDVVPYVPIADGWRHSYLVFTFGALVAGVLAWLLVMGRHGQPARAFSLGAILFACLGIVFAAYGIDGAQMGRPYEATDAGFHVSLVGYVTLIAAGIALMATSGKGRRASRIAPMILLVIVILLAGCGGPASSVFNQSPPLPSDTVITYVTASNYGIPASVVGLRARDGAQLWKTAIGLRDNDGAMAVVGSMLYMEGGSTLMTASQPGSGAVVAVRLRDGALLWRVRLPGIDSRISVAADETTVVVSAGKVGLYALNPADGSVRWHQDMDIDGAPYIGGGVVVVTLTSNPAVGNLQGGLAAFRESDGATLWRTSFGGTFVANPLAVYILSADTLLALATADGHELWHYQAGRIVSGSKDNYYGAVAAVSPNLVLVQTHFAEVDYTKPSKDYVVALDARTGTARWRTAQMFDLPSPIFGATATGGATIYGGFKSKLVALRSSDGTQLWQANISPYSLRQIVEVGDTLFALLDPPPCEWGPCSGPTSVRLTAISGATGAVYWERDLSDVIYLAPVA